MLSVVILERNVHNLHCKMFLKLILPLVRYHGLHFSEMNFRRSSAVSFISTWPSHPVMGFPEILLR